MYSSTCADFCVGSIPLGSRQALPNFNPLADFFLKWKIKQSILWKQLLSETISCSYSCVAVKMGCRMAAAVPALLGIYATDKIFITLQI